MTDAQARLYFTLCFCVSLLGAWYADYILLNHDVASFIAFAQEFLAGKHFYTDIIDPQTPLITLFSVLPVEMNRLTGLPIPESFILLVFVILQVCTLFAWAILRRNPLCSSRGQEYAILFTLVFGLFVLPSGIDIIFSSYGQREHLMCALILPYVALALNRMEGVEATRGCKTGAGILAGIGFCIKPHFALYFVALELFGMLRERRFFAWNRADAWGAGLLMLVYYLGIVIFTPGYLALIPMFIVNYKGYEDRWPQILTNAFFTFVPPALMVLAKRRSMYAPVLFYLLTIVFCTEIIYCIEKCAYNYHLFPALFFSLLLFVFGLMPGQEPFTILVKVFPAFVFCVATITEGFNLKTQLERRDFILRVAEAIRPYKSIAYLNTSSLDLFPAVIYAGSQWKLGISFMQYLPGAYMDARGTGKEPHYHTLSEMSVSERFFQENVMHSLLELPDAIIIDEAEDKYEFPRMRFDYLHYLMQDPRFRELWKHYTFAGHIPGTCSRPYCAVPKMFCTHYRENAVYRRSN